MVKFIEEFDKLANVPEFMKELGRLIQSSEAVSLLEEKGHWSLINSGRFRISSWQDRRYFQEVFDWTRTGYVCSLWMGECSYRIRDQRSFSSFRLVSRRQSISWCWESMRKTSLALTIRNCRRDHPRWIIRRRVTSNTEERKMILIVEDKGREEGKFRKFWWRIGSRREERRRKN